MAEYTALEELQALELIERILDLPSPQRINAIRQDESASERVKQRALRLLDDGSAGQARLQTAGAAPFAKRLVDIPARIGAYRLTEEIGRGGMGVVYKAVRDTGDFDHEAAIKMVLTGALSDRMVERFRYERQTLANLNHPGIARLFDGGETDDDLPYLVMELVEGMSLRKWLEIAQPSREARFAVLHQLFDALQYAHARLVIHRDLTPDNVIINEEGQAKLIDFGLSSLQSMRAVEADDTSAELFTGRSGTPGFTAPEYGPETGPGVTLDIYALGKLIDFLFADIDDRELRAIIARASATDADARYETVEALASDIERLRSGRSVAAFAGGPAYRARKFVLRNWLPVGAAAAIALAIVSALAVVTTSLGREREARALAEERFDAVRDLANFQLFDVYDALKGTPGSTDVLASLITRSQAYLEQLSATDQGDEELRYEAALAMLRLANIQGDPIGSSLGLREESEATRDQGVAILRELHEADPANAQYRLSLSQALAAQSEFANFALDDVEAAMQLAQKAQTVARGETMNRALHIAYFDAVTKEAEPLPWVGETARSLEILATADRYWNQHIANQELSNTDHARRAKFISQLAQSRAFDFEATMDNETGERALRDFAQVIDIHKSLAREGFEVKTSFRNVAIAIYERTLILSLMKREPQALAELEEAERLMRTIIRDDPADQEALNYLAIVLSHKVAMSAFTGKASNVLAEAEEIVALQQRLLEANPDNRQRKVNLGSVALTSADAFEKAGRMNRACEYNQLSARIRDELNAERELNEYLRNAIFNDLPDRIARTCN